MKNLVFILSFVLFLSYNIKAQQQVKQQETATVTATFKSCHIEERDALVFKTEDGHFLKFYGEGHNLNKFQLCNDENGSKTPNQEYVGKKFKITYTWHKVMEPANGVSGDKVLKNEKVITAIFLVE